MTDYTVGAGGGDFEDTARRAQEAAQKIEELNRAEARRRESAERTAGTEAGNAQARRELAGSTDELSSALKTNLGVIGSETEVLAANTAALRANLDLRRQIANLPAFSGSLAAPGVPYAAPRTATGGGGGARPPTAPVVAAGAPQEDPNFRQRLASAQRGLAEAELAQTSAAAEAKRARGRAGTTPQELQPLIEQRNLTTQELAAARRELRAAEANAEAQERLAVAKREQLAEITRTNAALGRERALAEAQATQSVANRVERAGAAVSGYAPLQLGPGRPAIQLGQGGLYQMPPVPPAPPAASGQPRVFQMGAASGWHGVTSGGPAEQIKLPDDEEQANKVEAYRQRATANAAAVRNLTAAQQESNQAFREAGAAYADASTRLTRHGALTTEFIGALARGQVTLGEFSSQLVATIGKFGGWAVAAAAVYGVVGAMRDLLHGATETQGAVQQLGRFIPGLGGPAGGGREQVGAAAESVRNISTQFNVPISDVTEAMMITARTFHNLSDAGDAARAVLAVTRLDQVPQAQAEQYLIGVTQGLNFTQGRQVIGVVESLNQLQVSLGARVAQTLPAIARAAPAARAAGLDTPSLESLAAIGVRSGISGSQVGTGIVRSVSNFLFSPSSEVQLGRYGIRPQVGEAGDAFRQIFSFIDRMSRSNLDQGQQGNIIRNLAVAVGGPQLGGRIFAPIFEQEALRPGLYGQGRQLAQHPRSFEEDLRQVLSTVSERFKGVGIALANFGSQLGQAGLLAPLTATLDAFTAVAHVAQTLLSPLTRVLSAFNELPTPMRDLIGLVVAARGAQLLARTQLGGTAQQFLGRLPGLNDLRGPNAASAVQGIRGQLETYLLPQQRLDTEAAALRNTRAQGAYRDSLAEVARFQEANLAAAAQPIGTPERERYEGGLSERIGTRNELAQRAEQAEKEFATQAGRSAELEAQLAILKDRHLTYAQRAAFAEREGYVASETVVDLKQQLVAQYRAQLRSAEGVTGLATAEAAGTIGGRAGGAGGIAGAGETVLAGGAAALGLSIARSVAKDPQTMRNVAEAAAASPAAERYLAGERTGGLARAAQEQAQAGVTRDAEAAAAAGAAGRYLAGERTGGLRSQAFERAYGGIEGARYAGPTATAESATRLGQLSDRLGGLGQRISSMAGFALAGPGTPVAGLLASQLIGGAIGGGTGNYVQNVGGGAATGALIAQMLGRGTPVGLLGGAALGSLATNASEGHALGAGAGALAGGLVGGALGTLTDWFTFGAGTVGGVALGSTVGGFIQQQLEGDKKPKQGPTQQDIVAEANRRVAQIMQTGTPSEQLQLFGGDVAQSMYDQTYGTGQGQARGQATIQSILNNLTAQQTLFGTAGPQSGGVGSRQLSTVLTTAIGVARQNPAAAQQTINAATQPFLGGIQQSFQYALGQATTPTQARNAASAARRAYQETIGGAYDQSIADAQTDFHAAQHILEEALRGGSLKAINAAEKQYNIARANLTGSQNQGQIAKQARAAANQAFAAASLQQQQQDIATTAALAQARSGGDRLQALQAGHQQGLDDLRAADTTPGLTPHDRREARRKALTEITTNWTGQVQARFERVQAAASLSATEAAVPGDPVRTQRAQLGAAQTALAYMRQHERAFDPAQIMAQEQQVVSLQQQVVQSQADQAMQLEQVGSQIAAAHQYGDQEAQARTILAGARQAIGLAVGPVARRNAVLNAIQAQNAVYDAQQQRVQEDSQLAQSLHPNDAVAQARGAINLANRERAVAHGYDQRTKAETDLHNADAALSGAYANRATELGALAASQTREPMGQLGAQISGAQRALDASVGFDARTQARTNLNNLKNQRIGLLASQGEENIQFQFDMMQITTGQAIKELQGLLRIQGLTRAERQQLMEQIRRYQTGQEQPIGAQGFDLAPGNVRLPTFYDVHHALQRGQVPAGVEAHDARHIATTINVYVAKPEHAGIVADVIDRATGGNLQQRLRVAGVR